VILPRVSCRHLSGNGWPAVPYIPVRFQQRPPFPQYRAGVMLADARTRATKLIADEALTICRAAALASNARSQPSQRNTACGVAMRKLLMAAGNVVIERNTPRLSGRLGSVAIRPGTRGRGGMTAKPGAYQWGVTWRLVPGRRADSLSVGFGRCYSEER
jgi:hypothetical protein